MFEDYAAMAKKQVCRLTFSLDKKCGKVEPYDRAFVATPLPMYTHTQNTLKFTTPPISYQVAIAVLKVSNSSEATNLPRSAVSSHARAGIRHIDRWLDQLKAA